VTAGRRSALIRNQSRLKGLTLWPSWWAEYPSCKHDGIPIQINEDRARLESTGMEHVTVPEKPTTHVKEESNQALLFSTVAASFSISRSI